VLTFPRYCIRIIVNSILFRGGKVLVPESEDRVHVVTSDVLIEGNKIRIFRPPSAATKVIECAGKIVSPGFVENASTSMADAAEGTPFG
jgi:cytosine/adenosine deaminase-related metal-dependent hydrolase